MRDRLKRSQFLVGSMKAVRHLPLDLRRLKASLSRRRAVLNYLNDNSVRKLQIGSGKNLLPGWLNTDFMPRYAGQVYLDATQVFPFPDGTFDYIFSEHVIEHLWYREGRAMLKESLRVLKPGGIIRIATPNLRQIMSLLDSGDDDLRNRYVKLAADEHVRDQHEYRPAFVVNNFFWDFGHYFVYDLDTLARTMELCGFASIRERLPGESDDPNLLGIESHGKVIGDEMNRFETMVLEGQKP